MGEKVDVDCRGLACPQPVMKTREKLAEARGGFTVLVDNATARDNVKRFAESQGCAVEVRGREGDFTLELTPGSCAPAQETPRRAGTVIFFSSDLVGTGDPELGGALMKAFLFTCAEGEVTPETLIFMNSGVRLVTDNEETAASVKRLEERGASVVACGTCLDFYGLKESLKAGRVGNMYEIHSILAGAGHLISI